MKKKKDDKIPKKKKSENKTKKYFPCRFKKFVIN